MGGEGPIYFAAVRQYAEQYEISKEHFDVFRVLLMAMDEEYLVYAAERDEERRKREAQKR